MSYETGKSYGLYIDGQWVDAAQTMDVLDPYDGSLVARVAKAGEADLGRIESVATIPAISTHQQQGEEGRELAGIPPQLMRLCIGGEHPSDIIADLDQALACIGKPKQALRQPARFATGGGASHDILKGAPAPARNGKPQPVDHRPASAAP